LKRTDYCGRIDRKRLGETVTVCGWVHRRRDHGGVIFIDLRDREGLVQIVCDPDRAATFAIAEKLRHEFVIAATGRVRPLPLFVYSSADAFAWMPAPTPTTRTGAIVRGEAARIAHLDPTPCPVPPDWSRDGYGSIFTAQDAGDI